MPRRKKLTWESALDFYEIHLRAARKSPLTTKGFSGEGATISPFLALSCSTFPACGARMRE